MEKYSKIHLFNKDPLYHEFPKKDLVNNVKDEKLFFKSNYRVIELIGQGDTINNLVTTGDVIYEGDNIFYNSITESYITQVTVTTESFFNTEEITYNIVTQSYFVTNSNYEGDTYNQEFNSYTSSITNAFYEYENLVQNITQSTINITEGSFDLLGDVIIGTDCNDSLTINSTVTASCNISSSGNLTVANITASGDISASGTIFATQIITSFLTASFITASTIITTGSNVFGDAVTDTHEFIGDLTASGDVLIGTNCNNSLTILSTVSASCDISSSGNVVGANITASGTISGEVIEGAINIIDTGDEDAAFHVIMVDGPTGAQELESDEGLTFNPSSNTLTVANSILLGSDITHNGDTDTKLFFPDNDTFQIDVGGRTFYSITQSDGANSRVNHGDLGAQINHHFRGSGTDQLFVIEGNRNRIGANHIPDENSQFFTISGSSNNGFVMNSSDEDHKFIIKGDNGHVGIGPLNPAYNLHVVSASTTYVAMFENSRGTDLHDSAIDGLGQGIRIKLNFASPAIDVSDLGDFFTGPVDTVPASLNGARFINFEDTNTTLGAIAMSPADAESIMYLTTSDKRRKEDIIDTSPKLETLLNLKVKDFKWKKSNTKSVGLIAQEVKETYPRAVMDYEEENKLRNLKEEDPEYQYMQVDYSKFVPILIKSVQEQQEIISSLQEEIKILKTKIK